MRGAAAGSPVSTMPRSPTMPSPTPNRALRLVTTTATAFSGLTATGGSLALLAGLDDFPSAWLRRTPFRDYTVPAALLTGVGTTSLAASVAVWKRHRLGAPLSVVAGLLMMGHVATEVVLLDQDTPGPTPTERLYFGTGLLTVGLALRLTLRLRRAIPTGRPTTIPSGS